MNKLETAAGSIAGGAIVIAGVSLTSGEFKGWLDVLDGALSRPGAVLLLLLAAVVCLIWLGIRGRQRERECDAKFGRLEQIVLHLLQGHPDSEVIIRNWDRIKTGELSLAEILPGVAPERRRPPRRVASDRRREA